MPALGGRVFSALMIAALAAPVARAQKACELDEGSPNQVARAKLQIQVAQSSAKPADAAAKLRDAVKYLADGDMVKNASGRAYVYGQVMVFWLAQPGMSSGYTTRGTVGFVTDTAAKFDIIAAIDSGFSIVEKTNPECASTTLSWRQQKGWVDLVNKAIELSNLPDKTDSAVMVAKRSLQLSRAAPYGYMVLAQAAAKGNRPKEAIDNYKAAIAAATDTAAAMRDNRRNFEMTLGAYTADLADQATGAEKTAYLAESKEAYTALAKDPGTKYADIARNGQARIATLSGDTTAIKGSYADQLANPGAFSYNSLMAAAVTAARANQTKDAIKLFEAAKAVNPYHRDVLYNLSRLYLLDSAYSKGLPLARQLIEIDPMNPDNYQLMAIAYASIKHGYDDQGKAFEARAKVYGQRANAPKVSASVLKANIDSAAKMTPLIKAYQDSSRVAVDSAIKYNDTMTKLPWRISFNEFTSTDTKTTAGGNIANLTDAPKSCTLKIQFVDKTGSVVTSQDVTVGPVNGHASMPFTATGTGAGIVAFKYPPCP
jgi:tetratricopeptide (TPR) repeat protein